MAIKDKSRIITNKYMHMHNYNECMKVGYLVADMNRFRENNAMLVTTAEQSAFIKDNKGNDTNVRDSIYVPKWVKTNDLLKLFFYASAIDKDNCTAFTVLLSESLTRKFMFDNSVLRYV